MTNYFVSRHPGAISWAGKQNLNIDHYLSHLEIDSIEAGDTVTGTLPIQLAAAVCAKNARYFHLTIELGAGQRGTELDDSQMQTCHARLEAFLIERVDHG